MKLQYRVSRFWAAYFVVRFFYLLFALFIYSKFTTLGDTERYLTSGQGFSSAVFYNSTTLMDFMGGLWGRLMGGSNILSNFPFMLVSFFCIRWAIEKLQFRKHIDNYLLFILLSTPNFCIWTSVYSKEIFGLVFSAIFGVLFVNFLKGDYKLHQRDLLATYLCLLFKPQYFPFIFQALLYIKISQKHCRSILSKTICFFAFVVINLGICWALTDTINTYAYFMPAHFINPSAESTRNETIWIGENAFFKEAPLGMFIAFWGPYPSEMISKPTHLIAGLESFYLITMMLVLAGKAIRRLVVDLYFDTVLIPAYLLLFTGIAFIHYPFGIFNPGSAIRYRTNFIFLFIIALLYLAQYYKEHTLSSRILKK